MKQVVYGKQSAIETPAGGVTGVLCRSLDSKYFFRIYHEDKTFTDYDLRHDDMTITIAAGELASLYRLDNGDGVLDHSSDVLGLTTKVVHVHNWLGRIYMVFVTPMHKLIVPSVMSKI